MTPEIEALTQRLTRLEHAVLELSRRDHLAGERQPPVTGFGPLRDLEMEFSLARLKNHEQPKIPKP